MTFIVGPFLAPQQGRKDRGQHGVDHMQQLLVRLRLNGLLPRKLERRSVIRHSRELCIERAAFCLELPRVQAEQNGIVSRRRASVMLYER